MKTQLIKLKDKFILVSNEKSPLKIGMKMYSSNDKVIYTIVNDYPISMEDKKIISENPDFSLLSEEDCKRIGFVDVEKLACNIYDLSFDEYKYIREHLSQTRELITEHYSDFGRSEIAEKYFDVISFIDGSNYKETAQSLNDKMFSEKQVRALVDSVTEFMSHHEPEEFNEWFEKKIQSLQQTSWEVKIEMEEVKCSKYGCGNSECLGGCIHTKSQPKITNNSIKIIKIL